MVSLSWKCSPRAGVLQARGIAQGHISGAAVLLARRPTSLKEGPDPGLQVVRKARLVESKVAARCPYRLMRILTDGRRERDDGDVLGGGTAPQRADDGDAVDLGKREIEHDEIEVLFLGPLEALFP